MQRNKASRVGCVRILAAALSLSFCVFIAWFNAGVRAVDIRDPYSPREAGLYARSVALQYLSCRQE